MLFGLLSDRFASGMQSNANTWSSVNITIMSLKFKLRYLDLDFISLLLGRFLSRSLFPIQLQILVAELLFHRA